jgi:hypothetical protein
MLHEHAAALTGIVTALSAYLALYNATLCLLLVPVMKRRASLADVCMSQSQNCDNQNGRYIADLVDR